MAVALSLYVIAASQATAAPPEPLEVNPDPADFGSVQVGAIGELPIAVRNTSGIDVSVEDVGLSPSDGAFFIIADSCEDALLRPDEACELTVSFLPTAGGEFSGTIDFVTSSGTVSVALAGAGEEAASATVEDSVPADTSPGAGETEPPIDTLPTEQTTSGAEATEPPIGPSTTVAEETETDAQRLAECERRAQNATVTFERARDMTLGQAEQFVVTVALVDETLVVTNAPTTAGDVAVEAVVLRCEVQAALRGSDFRIDPADFQQGSFLDRTSIDWSWDVVPLATGTSTLTLEIRSIVVIEGRRIEGAGGELYTSSITIDAKDEGWWDRSKRWSSEFVDHPLVRGFGSLLVIGGAIAAAWRWVLKRPWPWSKRPDGQATEQPRSNEP